MSPKQMSPKQMSPQRLPSRIFSRRRAVPDA